jgi:hypothetical protein
MAAPIVEPIQVPRVAAWRMSRIANAPPVRPALPYGQRIGAGVARMRDASLIFYRRLRGARAAGPVVPAQPDVLVRPLAAVTPEVSPWRQRLAPIYTYVRAAHILLAVGLIVLGLALALPWATNRRGLPLYLGNFTSPALAQVGVPVAGWAISAASHLVVWGACLGLLLLAGSVGAIAVNVSAYRGDMPGCLAGLLTPVIMLAGLGLLFDLALMAGFGFLGLLAELPALFDAGLTNQAATAPAPGFFLWWIGIVLSFFGTVGLMNMRTRVL